MREEVKLLTYGSEEVGPAAYILLIVHAHHIAQGLVGAELSSLKESFRLALVQSVIGGYAVALGEVLNSL